MVTCVCCARGRQVGGVASPLAKMAQVIGVPLIRLRLAIPEEMLPGTISSGTPWLKI